MLMCLRRRIRMNIVVCGMFRGQKWKVRDVHMLTYFARMQVMGLPDQYILRTWTCAVLTEDGTKVLKEALESARQRVALIKISRKEGEGSGIRVPISLGRQLSYKEPLLVRAKGYGKRKGEKEKPVKALRKCNGYGLTGQSHNKRKYPKLLNMYVHASKCVHV
ncbi:hypothetical protein RHSIM_Rhsim09G0062800 [Rhododendron simsii]|uniref:Uncharacterized protein n=1 Tax=Rhododendron simsii TaxID=118357 RepID=A0A834GII5_RHOSS|nr:hypothetical protein RHSIM_Rhsim09G0062800 [Rhododendron simsii]